MGRTLHNMLLFQLLKYLCITMRTEFGNQKKKALALGKQVKAEALNSNVHQQVKAEALNSNVHKMELTINN